MFTVITNYKKMFSSFIKNEFAFGENPQGITVADFKEGDELKDLKLLKEISKDNRIDSEEAKIIKRSLRYIE
jgi:predicted component of type VI protein secretion system